MKRTTITLSEDLEFLVSREAERRQSSVSAVIRELVAKGLGAPSNRRRTIPWAGLFHDPKMVAGENFEEALKGWGDAIHRHRG